MTIIKIAATVLSAVELEVKEKKVAAMTTPSPPQELKDKTTWLQCTLKNETQFNVLFRDTYFESGTYWDPPRSFGPFEQCVFSCINEDNAISGAAGGTSFRLVLDNDNYYDFSLGWISPLGSYKVGVAESSNPRDGYDAADKGSGIVRSEKIFQGKDKHGNLSDFRIDISATSSQKPLFVVKQVLVPTGIIPSLLNDALALVV
ncbi:hypothetical protein H0H81_012580 [Sphagnurus paluster]|uniref:Uncharacterized protein n=1 Tax=Sphagnurus paluster TaxID=117069 RepID=A0A9P7GS02_9AGAR|nr:hypothetical protein H0H81_012580 [Sphagnurus paluster]